MLIFMLLVVFKHLLAFLEKKIKPLKLGLKIFLKNTIY